MKHRKLLSLFSAALLGFSAAAFPPAALEPVELVADAATIITGTSSDGKWDYSYESGSSVAKIVKYKVYEAKPEIPEKINGKKITAIGQDAFKNSRIQSVTIPSSVKTIESFAFSGCYSMTEIVIPSSVTDINSFAFSDCTKLKKAEIQGAAKIYSYAFRNCSALENIILNSGCSRGASGQGFFNGCTSLKKINSTTIVSTSTNGKPVVTTDKKVRKMIELFMMRSDNIKFMKDYSNKLIDYIIKTELVAGMSDAIHARQLHNWLVNNCGYMVPGKKYNETKNGNNMEYQTSDNLFMSYALTGCGETVCSGYAKAYNRLLTAAHIESYMLYQDIGTKHQWNLAKIDGKWYYIDVTWDDTTGGYGTYKYFMKTRKQMEKMDSTYIDCGQSLSEDIERKRASMDVNTLAHEYLDKVEAAWKKSLDTSAYTDSNKDGILDGDWNLDGVKNSADTAIKKRLIKMQGQNAVQDSQMNKYVRLLHRERKTPEQFLSDEGY